MMTTMRRTVGLFCVLSLWSVGVVALAQIPQESKPQPRGASDNRNGGGSRIADNSVPPAYKPPLRGAPGGRVGGGSRAPGKTLKFTALAPNHTALTSREHPVLYWHQSLPASTPWNST
jgi:hypothetical protein